MKQKENFDYKLTCVECGKAFQTNHFNAFCPTCFKKYPLPRRSLKELKEILEQPKVVPQSFKRIMIPTPETYEDSA